MDSFTRDGLTFEVTDSGPLPDDRPERTVVLLHGFPEDRHCWSALIPQLVGAGMRVLAPDQRGYSPSARPAGRKAYTLSDLAADVLAMADQAGVGRFDVVGHDWGSAVAWELAGRHADRIRTATSLSVPHPSAMRHSLTRSPQLLRSWYMLAFQLPRLPEAALRRAGAERAVKGLVANGLDAETAARYAARLGDPARITGPLNWYRAIPWSLRQPLPTIAVPTLYVWGDGDHYITRQAALATARFVTGPYRFEALAGASHWLPSGAADRVGPLLLEHLAATPAEP